jgi:hypothetical protein
MKYLFIVTLLLAGLSMSCSKRISYPAPGLPQNGLKYYDDDKSHFYLLTFYRKLDTSPEEDFVFTGMTTYRDDNEALVDIDSARSRVRQYIALYFFRNGGVIYHYPYKFNPIDYPYEQLSFTNFEDFREQFLSNPSDFKNIMIGSLNAKTTNLQYASPLTIHDTSNLKNLSNEAKVAQSYQSAKITQNSQQNQNTSIINLIDTIPATVYLFRGSYVKKKNGHNGTISQIGSNRFDRISNIKGHKQILLICDLIPKKNSDGNVEINAVEITGLSYRTGVSAAGNNMMQTTINKTFDFGESTDGKFKPSLYFRLTTPKSEGRKNNFK